MPLDFPKEFDDALDHGFTSSQPLYHPLPPLEQFGKQPYAQPSLGQSSLHNFAVYQPPSEVFLSSSSSSSKRPLSSSSSSSSAAAASTTMAAPSFSFSEHAHPPPSSSHDLAGGFLEHEELRGLRKKGGSARGSEPLDDDDSLEPNQKSKKQLNHNESERRRQQSINDAIEKLKALVPGCSESRISKASVLARSVAYIEYIKTQVLKIKQENQLLRTLFQERKVSGKISPPPHFKQPDFSDQSSPSFTSQDSSSPSGYPSFDGADSGDSSLSQPHSSDSSPQLQPHYFPAQNSPHHLLNHHNHHNHHIHHNPHSHHTHHGPYPAAFNDYPGFDPVSELTPEQKAFVLRNSSDPSLQAMLNPMHPKSIPEDQGFPQLDTFSIMMPHGVQQPSFYSGDYAQEGFVALFVVASFFALFFDTPVSATTTNIVNAGSRMVLQTSLSEVTPSWSGPSWIVIISLKCLILYFIASYALQYRSLSDFKRNHDLELARRFRFLGEVALCSGDSEKAQENFHQALLYIGGNVGYTPHSTTTSLGFHAITQAFRHILHFIPFFLWFDTYLMRLRGTTAACREAKLALIGLYNANRQLKNINVECFSILLTAINLAECLDPSSQRLASVYTLFGTVLGMSPSLQHLSIFYYRRAEDISKNHGPLAMENLRVLRQAVMIPNQEMVWTETWVQVLGRKFLFGVALIGQFLLMLAGGTPTLH